MRKTISKEDRNTTLASIESLMIFLRFGPTELGNPSRELLRADDHWAFIQGKEGKEWELPHVKTKIETDIEQVLFKKGLVGNQAAFTRERLIREQGIPQERFGRAVGEMEDDGPIYSHQAELANGIATGAGVSKPEIRPKRGTGFSTWGKKIPLEDCEVQDFSIGGYISEKSTTSTPYDCPDGVEWFCETLNLRKRTNACCYTWS